MGLVHRELHWDNLSGPISISSVLSLWYRQISQGRLSVSCLEGSVLEWGQVGWSEREWRSSVSLCK